MNSEFSIQLNWAIGRRDSAERWALSHILRNKLWIVILLVGALGNAAGASLMFVYIGQAFNAVAQPPINCALIGAAAISIAVSQIVRGVLQLGRNFGSEVIGQRLERDTRHELYASLIGKSMTFHDQQSVGDVMARATNDVREVNLMLNPGLNLGVGSAMFLIVPLFVVPTLHPALIAVPLVYIIAYFVTLQRYLNQLQPATENVRRQFGDMNAVLAESIEGIETVKGAAQEEQAIDKFEAGAGAYRDAYVRQGFIEARFIPLLLLGLADAIGLAHSLILFRQGLIDIGQVVAFNGQLLLFGFPTFTSAFAYPQIASGLSSARRILALINAQSDLDENRAGYAGEMKGAIQFDHVTFNYRSDTPAQPHPPAPSPKIEKMISGEGERPLPPLENCFAQRFSGEGLGGEAKRLRSDTPVLDDVSFEARPGQTIAIVGQTGSGKTSIIKLLNRIYDAHAGRVLIDGLDVRDWQLAALRPQISIIEQDLFLFSRTVAENIKFGNVNATQEQVEAAAQAAQAHDFILNFTDGYNTLVGERGVTLSGGQRQRIALARALLTDPKILILDDATSAIDSATEDQIQQAIYNAARGRTTILITHRLSQIRWADVIVVMRGGKVAAIGSHDELLAKSGAYRRIFAR